MLTAGKTFVLGYTNETDGAYTRHPVVIFDDFTTASKYVDFDFKAKSSAMKMLSARSGEADLRFVYERMQLINYPIVDHKRRWIEEFSKLEVEVPGLEEQTAIAEVADELSRYITSLKRLITKKQAIKQGMMQELLTGRTRLPGFAGKWHRRPLAELLSYEQPTRYLVKTVKQLDSGRIPVLTAGKTFVLGYTNDSDGVYTSHPVIIFDDFTTASQYVDFDFKVKSSAMKILTARPGVDLRFVYERIQLIEFPLGDHKRYWISEYGKQEIEVPTKAEQTAISQIIADSDRELTLLDLRLAKARAIKQGMMQELLTGRTRLVVEGAA